jgi:hypothetical protein
MSLAELADNTLTDKNTTHSYLELYETLLKNKKDTAKHVLEVGLGDLKNKNGGSIKLWRDYFTNATIHGLDILGIDRVIDELKNDSRVVLYTETDAYNEEVFNDLFLNKNIKCDFMLDDGPHTLESMKTFIRLYSKIMTDDGILIVEDVQNIDWIQHLVEATPEHLRGCVKVYDLRYVKNRYDDIVFSIER